MHVIIVKLKVRPEHIAAFEAEMRRHTEWVRKNEKGCVLFEVSTDLKEPNTYHLYEIYKDATALREHEGTASLKQYLSLTRPWTESVVRNDATAWEF
jgi:(4S)-4-hydroxy-5-phosphonooxypentane-2,3-dione isomerase